METDATIGQLGEPRAANRAGEWVRCRDIRGRKVGGVKESEVVDQSWRGRGSRMRWMWDRMVAKE